MAGRLPQDLGPGTRDPQPRCGEPARGRWHAELRPDGAYYLEHGQYPSEPAGGSNNPGTRPAPGRSHDDVDASKLLTRLQNGGSIQIKAPTPAVRAAYRRAINNAITTGAVPDGLAQRHTGRDRGDLVISLVEARPVKPRPPAVPIPAAHDPAQPAIQHLLANPETFPVSATSRPRALALIQGLADAAAQRGYELRESRDTATTFRVDIGEDSFAFALREEYERREQVSREQIGTTKYAWQRVLRSPPWSRPVASPSSCSSAGTTPGGPTAAGGGCKTSSPLCSS